MKTILLVVAAACAGIAFSRQQPKNDPVLTRHEQAILEHRVTLSMTREEVTRSLGAPDSERTTPDGDVIWLWKSGRWVKFTGRALVDTGLQP